MAFPSTIRCGDVVFDGRRTFVVGVLNLTPDSFSDGGSFADPEAAVARGRALAAEGADLIDVGGESTRPGAHAVAAAVEIDRILPVVERLARAVPTPISIDTRKAAVAEAALQAGARMVNDVSGGRFDPALLEVCARRRAPLVLGHLRGEPALMQRAIGFGDVFEEVATELAASIAFARAAGVAQIIADPGIGFGKALEHNLALLARAGELGERLGVPIMVGPSRKSFLGALTGRPVGDRLAPTLGAVVAAALSGARFVRVHDVADTVAALRVAEAIAGAGSDRHASAATETPAERSA